MRPGVDPHRLSVLVTGATGRQGGVVAKRLLSAGHRVFALTRKPEASPVRKLQSRGARIVVGDFDDSMTYSWVMEDVDAVFAVSSPLECGLADEIRRGEMLVDAARRARIQHLVFCSLAGAASETGVAQLESKRAIEEHLQLSDVPYTVIAPVFLMENLLTEASVASLRCGSLSLGLPPARQLQIVAVADVGDIALKVFENRSAFLGERIELASDQLSGAQMARILSRSARRAITYAPIDLRQIRAWNENLAAMFQWLDGRGFDVDIELLHQSHSDIEWTRFERWVREHDWS